MLHLLGCSLVQEPRPPTGAVLFGEPDSPFDYGDRGRFQAQTARLGSRVHQVQRVIDRAIDLRGDLGYRLREKRDPIRSGQVVYSHSIDTTPPIVGILIAGRVPARSLSATRDAAARAGDYPPLTFPFARSPGPASGRRAPPARGSAPAWRTSPHQSRAVRSARGRASVRSALRLPSALARLSPRRRCGR